MRLSDALFGWFEGLKPRPPVNVSDWADEFRILDQKSSAEAGDYHTSRTPYLRAIMDDLSAHNPVEEVTLMKGVQLGGTEAGNNWIAYIIDHAPAPFMVVQPTVDLGKRWSRQRLAPMIENMPRLAEKIAPARSRDSGNTTLSKEFPGGVGVITGANTGTGLRSMPARYLMKDELDAWPVDVDKEGDPSTIVDARTTTFSRSKIFNISTPTEKASSRIWKKYLDGDQRKFHVPCPQCGELQVLTLQSLDWAKDDDGEPIPDSVTGVCVNGCEMPEHRKTWMMERGEWIPTGEPNDRHHSYHLPSYYSPLGWMSWSDIVRKFSESKGSREDLQVFTNLVDGMPFEDKAAQLDADRLMDRAALYPLGECQENDLILTAAVDTQPDRFELEVMAHGSTHSRVIDYQIINGDPDRRETRDRLDIALRAGYAHPAGGHLFIKAAAIDSGGSNTQSIYDFCRVRKHRHVIAIKGHSQRWKPIIGRPTKVDLTLSGKTKKNGAEVWMIGPDTAKLELFKRLALEEGEEGYIYLSSELPRAFFKQLTAEKIVTRYVKGFPVREFIKDRAVRNEALDVTAYNLCAFNHLGLHRWRLEQWHELEEEIKKPRTADLFEKPADSVADDNQGGKPISKPIKKPTTKRGNNRPRRRAPSRSSFVQSGGVYG